MVEDSESDMSDEEHTKEDKVLMVTNPKKFCKRNFSRLKNNNKNESAAIIYKQGSSNSEKSRSESFKIFQRDYKKKEKKLLGDSGFDYNHCHGKNHFAKECLLQKQNEKIENDKDEASYVKKIEELHKNLTKLVLVVTEDKNDDGNMEVW